MSKKISQDWLKWVLFPILATILIVLLPYNLLEGIKIGCFRLWVSDYGGLGSFVGGLTAPLLSIITIILVYKTFDLQRNELEATRKLVSEQKQELESTRLIANQQFELVKKQNFETTFFNILQLHNEIVNQISYVDQSDKLVRARILRDTQSIIPPITGKIAFKSYYMDLWQFYSRNSVDPNKGTGEPVAFENRSQKLIIEKSFLSFFKLYSDQLSHYFRSVENVLTFVDKSSVDDKEFYVSSFFTRMQTQESALVFYRMIFIDDDKFSKLLAKYKFHQLIEPSILFDGKHPSLVAKLIG